VLDSRAQPWADRAALPMLQRAGLARCDAFLQGWMVHKGIQHLQSPDVFLNPKRRGTDAGDGKYDDAEGREWVDRVASHYRHKGVSARDEPARAVKLWSCRPGQRSRRPAAVDHDRDRLRVRGRGSEQPPIASCSLHGAGLTGSCALPCRGPIAALLPLRQRRPNAFDPLWHIAHNLTLPPTVPYMCRLQDSIANVSAFEHFDGKYWEKRDAVVASPSTNTGGGKSYNLQ